MKTLHSLIGKYKVIPLVLLIVVFAALAGKLVHAATMTDQQKAALELPSVQQEIDDTQATADRNSTAMARKAQLLDCIQANNCSFLKGTTPAL